MSLNADPAATVSFKFERSIDDTKIDVRIRYMTRRDTMRHERLYEEVTAAKGDDASFWAKLQEMYEVGVVSPKFDELSDVLGDNDIIYLAINYPSAVQVAERELGKSKSRRLIAAVESAANATAATVPSDPAASGH